MVLVVAAAGIAGPAHFGGPRWVPNFNLHNTGQPPRPQHAAPTRSRPAPPLPRTRGGGSNVLVAILIGVGAVCALVILWRLFRNRRSWPGLNRRSRPAVSASVRPVEPEPEPDPDVPALVTGIELALQMLDEEREPADAIVRAWLGLQETAEESGIVRGPAETPTEFTSRILSLASADDRSVHTILRLYLQTRFGDHPVTADDASAVRDALRTLVESWQAAGGADPAGTGAR